MNSTIIWDQLQLHLLASSQFLQTLELHTSGKLEIILNENLDFPDAKSSSCSVEVEIFIFIFIV